MSLEEIAGFKRSFFRSRDKILKINDIKKIRFENFMKGLKSLNENNEKEVRLLLEKYLKTSKLSLRIYENVYNNLWETYKYLSSLSITESNINKSIFSGNLERRYIQEEEILSNKVLIYVSEIKEIIRFLLGEGRNDAILQYLIDINKKQINDIEKLLHPLNEDFIKLDERELDLEKLFNIEKEVTKMIDKKISQLNSITENFIFFFEKTYSDIKITKTKLIKYYKENPGFENKMIALSHYANSKASLIAFTIVSLSAMISLGPYLGATAATITTITSLFHGVATYGEGLQAIEEAKDVINKTLNWFKGFQGKILSDNQLKSIYASA